MRLATPKFYCHAMMHAVNKIFSISDCSKTSRAQAASAPVELTVALPSLRSAELQKPCQGQPSISEVLQVVLKECRKDNLVYKIAALRCAGDVLHASQEDYFSTMAEILFPLIKKVPDAHPLLAVVPPRRLNPH